MLDDTPRKLLRIMCHYRNHYRRMPGLPELMRMSGRTRAGVLSGCRELVQKGYIQWQPPEPVEHAEILEAWEKPGPGAYLRGHVTGHWSD